MYSITTIPGVGAYNDQVINGVYGSSLIHDRFSDLSYISSSSSGMHNYDRDTYTWPNARVRAAFFFFFKENGKQN